MNQIISRIKLNNSENDIHKILKKNPNHAKSIIELGKLYRREEKHEQALELFERALQLKPRNIWIYILVARELQYFSKFDESEQKLQQALDYSPQNFDVLMHLGELASRRHQIEKSLDYFQQALIYHPSEIKPIFKILPILYNTKISNPQIFNKIQEKLDTIFQQYSNQYNILTYYGHWFRKLGQRKQALSWFKLAAENTEFPEQIIKARLQQIEELNILGDFHQAKINIEAILKQEPENIEAQMLKVNLLRQNINLREATKICQNILSIKPNYLECRLELARIYSQSGQVETAINLLEETQQLLGNNFKVLKLLGSLHQDLEDFAIARKWYQKACQEYPDNSYIYVDLANLSFLQGETTSAIQLLESAKEKVSNSLVLNLKLIELRIILGDFALAHQLLLQELKQVPDNIDLLWQLCYLHMEQGNYALALEVLDQISTDDQNWIRRIEQRKGNIHLFLYDYQKAEDYLKQSIVLAPVAPYQRNRLATVFMLTGRIEQARQEFKIATQEFSLKIPSQKFSVPLRSHSAMIANELGINPPLMKKLHAAQQETGHNRILSLGSILAQEPNYLGSALYLAKELRIQGIFEQIQQGLSQNSRNFSAIPKRIVQFWDQLEPPQQVQEICQSWRDRNPEYEYMRFSLKTAAAFVREHYDQKVLKAFARCDQPAMQADFFRLAYLNKMGGFYADADDLCHQSLDTIVNLNPELVIIQEELAAFGNNFLGCVPGQPMIRVALHQAVKNLSDYSNESPWFSTGPGLLTSTICSGILPYLTYQDYQFWPRLLVLSQSQLRKIIHQHMSLPYKKTAKSWQQNAYQRRVKCQLGT